MNLLGSVIKKAGIVRENMTFIVYSERNLEGLASWKRGESQSQFLTLIGMFLKIKTFKRKTILHGFGEWSLNRFLMPCLEHKETP